MTTWVGPHDEPHRYRFAGDGEPVGEGGEGFVYRAWRAADDRPVAVKQLVSVTPADWAIQSRRIQILATVTHPRLGRHLESFVGPYPFTGDVPPAEEFEVCYTVMAWIEGRDLSDAVDGVDLRVGLGWVRDVAHGAAALHRHPTPTGLGIVHRDIKPSNVRITGAETTTGLAPDPRRAVLIDFGIARPLGGSTMTRTAGAPGWMPPEAFEDPRAIGVRSDNWQVGGLAAWVLLGTPPGALVGDDRRHRLDEALRRRGVPAPSARRLARHIDRALAGRPADRPRDLERWGDALVALATADPAHRRRKLIALGVAILLIAVAGLTARLVTAPPDAGGEPVAAGPVGTITPDPARSAPFDFGERIPVAVDHSPTADPAARLVVQAQSGGRPTPGAPAVEVEIAGPRQVVSLTVSDAADGAPVVIDELVVLSVSATGAPVAEQRTPTRLTVAPPVPDPQRCTRYDPAAVTIEPVPPALHRVSAGAVELGRLPSLADAEHARDVARQADEVCLLGPADGAVPPVQYWRRGGRLVGELAPSPARDTGAPCPAYDPSRLSVDDARASVLDGQDTLLSVAGADDARQALTVARHYRRLCVLGRGRSGSAADARRTTFTYWQ